VKAEEKNKNKNKKMQNITNFQANGLGYGGWKYYNTIKKKAMEKEFSWSGLIISLSIAFFIVLIASQILSMIYASISATGNYEEFPRRKIYYLEDARRVNIHIHAPEKANTDYAKTKLSESTA